MKLEKLFMNLLKVYRMTEMTLQKTARRAVFVAMETPLLNHLTETDIKVGTLEKNLTNTKSV